ncbi:TSUP family transporter [Oceanithermus sp.]|uniref:TSUP family transporter n=1 Tax=Oceanithermus sp. TaxID=2268145 RepID=UPI0025D8A147|nr:TSUP family transporter [Oceanithermus sp.]
MLISWTVLFWIALIVGFVTSSLRIWIDRVFVTLLLLTIGHLPIDAAVRVNLLVLLFAALSHGLIRREGWLWGAFGRFPSWEGWAAVLGGFVGGVLGRVWAQSLTAGVLVGVLGAYAIAMGLRLLLVKPGEGKPAPEHPGWIAPIALGAGLFTGLISAGGKPFTVPLYNWAVGHKLPVAYAIGTFGAIAAALGAVLAGYVYGPGFSGPTWATALAIWLGVSLVAWLTDRIWSPRLMKVTALLVAVVLISIGVKLLVQVS